MGKPSAPPPPDYAALARQQGQESRETAIYNNAINRVNQVGPNGSITWSIRPGADPNNPQPGDYIQTTSLSPEQQRLQQGQNAISQQFLDTAQSGLGRVGDAMASKFDTSGLPGLGSVNATGQPQVGSVNPSNLQMSLNTGNLPGLSGSGSREAIIQAMMSRQNRDIDQQQGALENKLLNSGIERGTEAWNREMDQINRRRTDALQQAYLGAGQELSRDAGVDLANRQQLFGEAAQSGSFANTAAGQDFAQRLQSGGFANSAARDALSQLMAATALNNQVRGQGIQEQAYLRSLPINEINALRTGAQVSAPQFGSYYTGGTAQAAPIMDAGIAQGNYNMSAYQQDMAGYNAMLGGLASLGTAYLMPTPVKP